MLLEMVVAAVAMMVVTAVTTMVAVELAEVMVMGTQTGHTAGGAVWLRQRQ